MIIFCVFYQNKMKMPNVFVKTTTFLWLLDRLLKKWVPKALKADFVAFFLLLEKNDFWGRRPSFLFSWFLHSHPKTFWTKKVYLKVKIDNFLHFLSPHFLCWVSEFVVLSVAQLITIVIFFSAWDKSRVKWHNSQNSTQKIRTFVQTLQDIFFTYFVYKRIKSWIL